MGERYTLPVLPLRDTVVYPGVAVPISAGRTATVAAVQEALEGDSAEVDLVNLAWTPKPTIEELVAKVEAQAEEVSSLKRQLTEVKAAQAKEVVALQSQLTAQAGEVATFKTQQPLEVGALRTQLEELKAFITEKLGS